MTLFVCYNLAPDKTSANYSREMAMAFGKIGRPPEDRFARRCEIFKAVSPLILTAGVRRLTMRQAAQVACLSIGGLYYYFPTKRELVLYGLHWETLSRLCQNFLDENGYLAERDPRQYLEKYSIFAVQEMAFVRPALHAAVELGVETFQVFVDTALNVMTARLANIVRTISPEISAESIAQLERSWKRQILGACLDKDVAPDALRNEILAVFASYTSAQIRREDSAELNTRK